MQRSYLPARRRGKRWHARKRARDAVGHSGVRGLCIIVLAGCISNRLGPGVLRSDWQQPRRDPDPTADFTKEQMTNPWVPEGEAAQAAPGTARYEATRALATAAAIIAGAAPALVWYGLFDENLLAPRTARPSSRAPRDSGTTSDSPPP